MGILQRNDVSQYAASQTQRRAASAREEAPAASAWEELMLYVPLTDDGRQIKETLRANGYLWVYAYVEEGDLPGMPWEDVERSRISGRDLRNRYRDRTDVGIGIVEGRGPDRKITEVVLPDPAPVLPATPEIPGTPTRDARPSPRDRR